jgi:hypothetical protein
VPLEELEEDERFDIHVAARVRTELLPRMQGLPTAVLAAAVDVFQEGSIIYPGAHTPSVALYTHTVRFAWPSWLLRVHAAPVSVSVPACVCWWARGPVPLSHACSAGADVDTGADQLVVREKFAAACLTNLFELSTTLPPGGALSAGVCPTRTADCSSRGATD